MDGHRLLVENKRIKRRKRRIPPDNFEGKRNIRRSGRIWSKKTLYGHGLFFFKNGNRPAKIIKRIARFAGFFFGKPRVRFEHDGEIRYGSFIRVGKTNRCGERRVNTGEDFFWRVNQKDDGRL